LVPATPSQDYTVSLANIKDYFTPPRVHLPFVGGNLHKNCLSYMEKTL